MKKTLTYSVLLLVAACAIPGISIYGGSTIEAQVSGSSYKIGIVNRKAVFDDYGKQKAGLADLQKERDALQVEMDRLSDDIKAKQDRFQQNAESMSEEERAALRDEIASEFRTYEAEFKRRQGDMDQKSQRFIEEMMKDINDAVQQVGRDGGYHLILEADPRSASSVVYYDTAIDITPQVILLLNN